jgi:uncharacterized glyoxalase superfamily protein PhnB/mannose-6-phosphate isomerase-like protein (cupin superfamily)
MLPDDLATLTEEPQSPIGEFAFHGCTCGVGCFSGRPPWERHTAGDELLHVLAGTVELTLLEGDEPGTVTLNAGALCLVKQSVWHRSFAPDGVTILYMTPTEGNQHSFADDPRSEGADAGQQPVLSSVDLVVDDVDAAVRFYRRLGLAIPDDRVWRSGGTAHHVEVETMSAFTLQIDSIDLTKAYDARWRSPEGGGSRNVLIFSVPSRDTVDELYVELTSGGYHGHQPPFDAFWGARYAIVEDPGGNVVGVMSPSEPGREGPPPML